MSEISTAPIKNPAKLVTDLMKVWEKYDFYDKDLWDCFRKIFENTQITEEKFKKIDKIEFKKFRKFLKQRGVWINRELSIPISRALLEIITENTKST